MTLAIVFPIRPARQRFVNTAHEPANAAQPLTPMFEVAAADVVFTAEKGAPAQRDVQ